MTLRLALFVALLAGCATVPDASLDGTEWLSISITEDGADRPLVDRTQIRLSFTDGQFGASAGCNTMGGDYRLEGGMLIMEGGGMTEMGCDDERHAQDDWLVHFLGSQPSAVRSEDKLTLTANETVIALQDSEIAEPDLPLTGTTWTVDSIISGDAVSSVADLATLAFTDDGRVEVNTGCNTGSGVYEETNGTLHIRELFTTLRACSRGPAQLEGAVLAVLHAEEIAYAIDSGSLTLMAGDQGLGLRGD